MLKSLSLLAVLALSAIAQPSPAHAGTCSMTLLYGYSKSWVPTQFSPALVPQSNISCPYNPTTNGCSSPAQNRECKQCSQSGVTGWWDWEQSDHCDNWLPMNIHGYVTYRPNPAYHYHYKCTCSEGVNSCAWV